MLQSKSGEIIAIVNPFKLDPVAFVDVVDFGIWTNRMGALLIDISKKRKSSEKSNDSRASQSEVRYRCQVEISFMELLESGE